MPKDLYWNCTREGAQRLPHRHPPRTQPVAPLRERPCRRPRLTPGGVHRSGPISRSGPPQWRTPEAKRPHGLTMPRDAMPARLSSFCLPAMASSPLDARRNLLI